ncbi:DUF262 domain-containing protein [Campylobacter cuniculorum]|uniref:GmrSD restriction endonucleases N-terminal domain-containing protein n=2 Tax=Campylobacter cuniculorum TaxID=374106 RepID=A0A1W6BV65_9BACT|nr:DUF262 domain-containing protein [Campylobacter cuniculorum]ARJ55993.1 hypothetical protein (DUF262 domain) [Campylobacter cuniculorum DSM 23162 = LMG 24588]QOR05214.1 DUF262 domain-containing protein [Campylobacter cuniculorum]
MKEKEELEGEYSLDINNNENDEQTYPLENIRIEKGRMSLFEIKRRQEKGDIEISPEFQRENVWKEKQKSELIESVLMGIPIPVFYFFESKDTKIQIVDGRQRISTFIDFMNDKFELKQLNIIKDIISKKFSDLTAIQKRKIEDYQIDIYTIQPPTPEQVKFNIFDRVNRGGTQLNNQEMRNALYQGKSTELIKNLSELEIFKKATGNSIKPKRMKDRYIILRFIGFYLYFYRILPNDIQYKGNINEFLSKIMIFLNNKRDSYLIGEIEANFKRIMTFAHKNYGENIFRFNNSNENRRPINMALFESLSYLFALCYETNIIPKKEKIEKLKSEFDSSKKFIIGIDSIPSVEYRFNKVTEFFNKVKNDYKY